MEQMMACLLGEKKANQEAMQPNMEGSREMMA
jgi:hypothetical protein